MAPCARCDGTVKTRRCPHLAVDPALDLQPTHDVPVRHGGCGAFLSVELASDLSVERGALTASGAARPRPPRTAHRAPRINRSVVRRRRCPEATRHTQGRSRQAGRQRQADRSPDLARDPAPLPPQGPRWRVPAPVSAGYQSAGSQAAGTPRSRTAAAAAVAGAARCRPPPRTTALLVLPAAAACAHCRRRRGG
eukprot:COSAG01_NODE_3046_length_6672_cov_4.249962_6_plen_194_part_00